MLLCFWLWVQSDPLFIEKAEESGLAFQYCNGAYGNYWFPEITGGGVALLDFDQDGDLDVFLIQATWLGPESEKNKAWVPCTPQGGRLFKNLGNPLQFEDVTSKAGIATRGYGQGVAVGDVNADGWPDLYITQFGSNELWLNQKDGTFKDATESFGLKDGGWSTSATFLDYDRDGFEDLYVCHYVDYAISHAPTCYATNSAQDYCGPDCCPATQDSLYHNEKGQGFTNVSALLTGFEKGAGLGVVSLDANGDLWPDLYVANDGDANHLLINSGKGTFSDEALFSGLAVNASGSPEASMGIASGDFDRDGDEDLFLTHLDGETNTLYRNAGGGDFQDRTAAMGLAGPSLPYTGFGTQFVDLDNDGWLDLVCFNGAVHSQVGISPDHGALKQKNLIFMSLSGTKFAESTARGGAAFQVPSVSRGAAFGDLDNDGDSDIIVSQLNAPVSLFLNQVGQKQPWIGVHLLNAKGLDALGAKVEAKMETGPSQFRWVRRDGSYASSNDPRLLFGLGEQKLKALIITWPDASQERLEAPALNRYHRLTQKSSKN
ncbi:MAG: CRTAC1 family protein [Acidobacteria bacterium]|nr:CRTAC1 family protein [Acidobacteriota bacterium]MCB9398417.1 CRTAC1 family protein [Acidobacteriota bacterium]